MNTVLFLRDGAFWELDGEDVLALGQQLKTLFRNAYTVHVHLAGETDTRGWPHSGRAPGQRRCSGRSC